MLSFEEIEDCFPDGACSDDATGKTLVSAQWLHDFAHTVAAKEREACEALHQHEEVIAPIGNSTWGEAHQQGWIDGTAAYRDAISKRSNKPRLPARAAGAASALSAGLGAISHGGSDRGYKLCRCNDCGQESICTPENDFYTTANDDNGPLKCERCFAKYALDSL